MRLNTLFQTIPDLIWVKDKNGVYLACNSAVEHLFGAQKSEIIGKTGHDFVGTDLTESFHADDLAAIDANKPIVIGGMADLCQRWPQSAFRSHQSTHARAGR